jgi:hypothetical protein
VALECQNLKDEEQKLVEELEILYCDKSDARRLCVPRFLQQKPRLIV